MSKAAGTPAPRVMVAQFFSRSLWAVKDHRTALIAAAALTLNAVSHCSTWPIGNNQAILKAMAVSRLARNIAMLHLAKNWNAGCVVVISVNRV